MGGVAERGLERVRAVAPYRAGRASTGALSDKLSSNEAPLGPAPAVRAAVAHAAAAIGRYPAEAEVLGRFAGFVGVGQDRLLLTNGSDELCYLLADVFLGPGSLAVLGEPCYQIDATASAVSGASLRRVPLKDGRHDIDAMVAASQGAQVLWLPTPHNPTGVAADPRELDELLGGVDPECLVVIDEAYRAFVDEELLADSLSLLERHENLVVQRTLSKDWALAGLRVGYALASAPIIEALSRARPPFSVNTVALAALDAGIGQGPWREMSVARVREERARLEATLAELGIECYPSQANFVSARIAHDRLAPLLATTGLVVRAGEDLGLAGWVRISVGWAPQMADLRAALRQLAAGDGHARGD